MSRDSPKLKLSTNPFGAGNRLDLDFSLVRNPRGVGGVGGVGGWGRSLTPHTPHTPLPLTLPTLPTPQKMIKKKKQTEQPLAEKVDAILAGAMQEFLENGYAATTMDRVTAAAGVSKTTVYSYFQDKETLFAAIVERLAKEKCLSLFNPEDPEFHEGDPKIVLRRVATDILEKVTCEQEFIGLIRLIIGESGRFPLLAQVFLRNIEKPGLELISQYFIAHPELQLPDAVVAGRIFMGTLVHFMILQYMLHGEDILPMESDRLIDNLVKLITINQIPKTELTDKYSGTRQKSLRRKRNSSGKFQPDYGSETKQLRSIRLTDTAWEKLAQLAADNNLTRSEMIELFARQTSLEPGGNKFD